MITGFVNANRDAVIRFPVYDQNGQVHEIQAVIDTGFSGYLNLPETLVNALKLPYHSRTIVTLGDGSDRIYANILLLWIGVGKIATFWYLRLKAIY